MVLKNDKFNSIGSMVTINLWYSFQNTTQGKDYKKRKTTITYMVELEVRALQLPVVESVAVAEESVVAEEEYQGVKSAEHQLVEGVLPHCSSFQQYFDCMVFR